MKLYLDDDTADPLLARLLRAAGHDVQLPAEVGLRGRSDPVHFAHAVRQARVVLTKNYRDFDELHNLSTALQGHHPGIIAIRQDNDRKRDLKPRGIVKALANLLASGTPIADNFIILNQWR